MSMTQQAGSNRAGIGHNNPPEPVQMAVRFDDAWTAYDPADLAAIRIGGAQVGFNQDADSLYFARALDYVKAVVYSRLLPPLAGDRLVPTATDTPIYAESVSYSIYDTVGFAKIISNYADDLPRVDVVAQEKSVRVRTIGDSYGYTINDLRIAIRDGAGLPTRRADAARAAVERKENSLKIKGDAAYGMFGLTSHPNIGLVVPTTGNWSAAATTGDQIVGDFTKMFDAIVNQSSGTHTPNTFGAPQAQFSAMRSKSTGPATAPGPKVITALQTLYPEVDFILAQEFKGAGTAGADVAFMGERNIENYWYDQVKSFEAYLPQARNLEFVISCDARTAGVIVARPLSAVRMEGV